MGIIWALYERRQYPSTDELLEEYETENEAREDLRVLNEYSEGDYYIREQEEKHNPWLTIDSAEEMCLREEW